MVSYIANHQKKKKIFRKREQELKHAIKHGFSQEKIAKAAEQLRQAKLNVFKSEYSKNSILPPSSYVPGEQAKMWQAYTVSGIVAQYTGKAT